MIKKVCIPITKILFTLNLLLVIIIIFISIKIKECFELEDPMILELKEDLKKIFSNNISYSGNLEPLNNRDILKEISITKGNKSYTINKKKIHMCLTDENGKYYNKNNLLYVLLHEISHVICNEVGHTKKFHDIFDEVLKLAEEKGVYDPKIPMISNYCNTN